MTPIMTYDEAVQIFLADSRLAADGHLWAQPSKRLSKRIHGVWYLRNKYYFLARIGGRCRNVF